MQKSSLFLENIEYCVGQIRNPELLRLVSLASFAKNGSFGPQWIQEFKQLGILHLLVLSGSQISHLKAVLDQLFQFLPRHIKASSITPRIYPLILFFAFFTVGQSFNWAPPLTRAIIQNSLLYFFPKMAETLLLLFSVILQGTLFPKHLHLLSFYLSWGSFLMLIISQKICPGKTSALVFQSIFCQLLCLGLLKQQVEVSGFIIMLVANICVGYLFEKYLMPSVGFLWIVALLPLSMLGQVILGPLNLVLTGSSTLVLVAVHSFRYIRSE